LSCDTTKAIEILAQRAGTLDLRGFCRVDAFCSRKYYDMQVSSPLSIALAYNNTITSLNVETYPYRSEDVDLLIGLSHDKGVNCIADMLLQNKSIQSLLLSGQVRISEKITDRLVKAARQNGNITELGIAGFLTNSSVLAELLAPEAKFVKLEFDVNSHADELSRLIATNTTVTSLKLSLTCGLGGFGSLEHESLPVLSEMFAQNSNIRTLSIAHSELNSKSMDFLADAFKRNTSITALDLQNNQADYSDSSSNAGIPRLLAENPRLIKLNLRANQLRDDVLTSIAVSLTNNSVLQELNLRKTSMSAKGALEIAKMLESNTSITDINLSENQVGTEGLLSILNSLEHNSTITHIDLMRIGVTRTPEQEEACIAMCQSRGVEMKFKENRIPESCASSFNIRCDDNRYRLYGF
jgi:Ran GTPase-activating protein (RanGAP) involved in mRNA processing and transport